MPECPAQRSTITAEIESLRTLQRRGVSMTIPVFFTGIQQVVLDVAGILSTTILGIRVIIVMWTPRRR
jgi:hypothetical protein